MAAAFGDLYLSAKPHQVTNEGVGEGCAHGVSWSQPWMGFGVPLLGLSQCCLTESLSRRRTRPLSIFRGLPQGLWLSSLRQRYWLDELNLGVGFVL